jgi:AcrR family transcriptional regulator
MASSPADRLAQDAHTHRDGKITRELVLTTALEIIDRDGLDGLSLRRLARALDRDPMIIYRHAPNKAALLDGVVETVLAQLKVDPADPDWAGQLRAVARDFRALALAHPNVVPLLVARPMATPLALRPLGTLRPFEDILALLTRAGFSGPDALHIYRALFGFLHGHVLNGLQELVDNPDETDDLLRLGLHRLPISEFPLLRSLAPVLAAYDGEAELESGLDILLTGLAATLPRQLDTPPVLGIARRRSRVHGTATGTGHPAASVTARRQHSAASSTLAWTGRTSARRVRVSIRRTRRCGAASRSSPPARRANFRPRTSAARPLQSMNSSPARSTMISGSRAVASANAVATPAASAASSSPHSATTT